MNTAKFTALQGYPVNWSSLGIKDVGIRVCITIETEEQITKAYLDKMATAIGGIREPNRHFLYDVKPAYPEGVV